MTPERKQLQKEAEDEIEQATVDSKGVPTPLQRQRIEAIAEAADQVGDGKSLR